jgi:predicted PurR-regulated permease PerM
MFGLVPIVGTTGISLPVAIYFFYKGAYLKGTFLLLWGLIVVVGLIDMVLRPYLMGRRAELPMFALFFALLGTKVWGAKGLLLGPFLIGIVPVLLDIYRERYLRKMDFNEKTTDSSGKLMSIPSREFYR